jgi:hypothetical protein
MLPLSATQVRNEWSAVVDSAIRERPQFIKRTRDNMILADINLLLEFLSVYTYNAIVFVEDNGSVTMSLNELDLVENGVNEQEALSKLAAAVLEYAEDYYEDFQYWSRGNRSAHKPYVFKALILGDIEKIGGLVKCHHGKI